MTVVDTMAGRIAHIRQRIADACARAGRSPDSVVLLPVSKTFEVDAIREAMALGLTRFGENKTQEIRQKAAALAGQGLQWVLIGHLQTNKAKDAARDATEVQSLDRTDLAEALHRRLLNEGRTLDVLVQVKTSTEPSKFGMAPEEVSAFLRRIAAEFPTLRVQGLMTLAVNSSDPEPVRACFRALRELRDSLRAENIDGVSLERLSMGMSGDFELAIEEGSTEVRIGTAIFGARTYPDPQ
ncbi:Predicted enzyme with a TIM-barrel fold [Achromobacter spanius]|uniref:YggS family pyridoxal phosphate-dependent enzyme n=1 Tax=Achromobacter spanius TaxID=217203 RepID=UPI000C2C44B0|nr:YggS family pyridoxal phosphate-dependent enzyme [Achromobacter spanius]AUA55958.1 YggS family pyridoxal phosphate-dependent enzyme [Achromobacter spanius]CAB3640660.1 Pyridoxal phosphate homeostasis protein [Achromobacter spanius]SPT41798.1 Predicted enzyme with a TIM-barrel fold [Achromobacter denitrificans]VEE56511.1 Predicted enzyme with a TIM-barrel fold [Achromobacter spanius]